MRDIKTIIISLVISIAIIVLALNVPVKYFSGAYWFGARIFGGLSLTDIQSTDRLSQYPTVQNANNTLIETVIDSITGTTTNSTITTLSGLTTAGSLSTVGTITSGSWNATAIPVNKGGTGTTTPTRYFVMFGDAGGGFTHASTTGTSGQLLTSQGAGAYPQWTTVSTDPAGTYNWSGAHTFSTATTTLNAPVLLNSTTTISAPLYGAQVTANVTAGMDLNKGQAVYVSLGGQAASNEGCTATGSSDNIGQSVPDQKSFQRFFLDSDTTYEYMTMTLKKVGSPTDNVQISINDYSGTSPTQYSYATATISAASLTTSFAEYTFPFFPAITLEGGKTYSLVLSNSGGVNASNYTSFQMNASGNPCSEGTRWYGDFGGWTEQATNDIHYTVVATSTNGLAFPTKADNAFYSDGFVGIVNAHYATSTTATVITQGVMTGLSGLQAGKTYWLQGSNGAFGKATSTSAVPWMVGKALDSTTLLISPSYGR